MFPSKRITALETQVRDLTSQLEAAQASVGLLTTERDELRGAVQANGTPQPAPEGSVSAEAHQAVVAERDQLQARVNALEARTPSQEAIEIAGNVAVPPVAPEGAPGAAEPQGAEAILAHYKGLPAGSAERFAFYQRHKSTIDFA